MTVTLPFTETAVPEIAALLGVAAAVEPYRVRDAAVYRLGIRNAVLDLDIAVLLWPSLARVDVRIGDCSIVYKDVASVELISGVEVIFRRAAGEGRLFVSIGGRASVVV